MTRLLDNHLAGRWQAGSGAGVPLFDPVLGTELVRVSGAGLDLAEGYAFARTRGGPALRALGYAERSAQLARIAEVLQGRRDAYYDIALQNSGTTRNDSAVDIDGAIYTLGQYARWGAKLGAARWLADGEPVKLGKDGSFQSGHILVPQRGIALFINAFNFPAWGLWEKAAPALLSGVPVVVKPATATAWLTQQMVADVIEAGVLPPGALSIVCGRSDGLIEALEPFDLVSFTGSADTARAICAHDNVLRYSIRVNAETDSLNSALLGPDATPGSDAFSLMVKEVVREMTVKSGQKCTAIRRVLVPQAHAAAATEAIAAALAAVKVGNPRNESVRMGALASRAQLAAVREGLAALGREAQLAWAGNEADLVDADPKVAACVMPHLLKVDDGDAAKLVHDVEVFGPAATVVPYRDADHACALARRGFGSLVASVFSDDVDFIARAATEMAHAHGRLHVITPAVGKTHTGHGNVMPMSLHGGPGRAGGGEELGGLRALGFYHQRSAVQAPPEVLAKLVEGAAPWQGGAG
ncbi:MAG: 3,4-dehydroadipyl-CoA semialdehyde dehydrogenase [Burkholderiaceae bacterium]|nr:3,4-dehydroadipyl-CoA semialdehyde dehydrogenase [Burkholderiaceae bacterium]